MDEETKPGVDRALGRLEGALDGIKESLAALVSRFDRLDTEVDRRVDEAYKHAEKAHARISNVERRGAYYAGGLAVIVFLLSYGPGLFEAVSSAIQMVK